MPADAGGSAGGVLLTGWFSFDTAEVTAGDLLARDTVHRWLHDAGVAHRVAVGANFRTGRDVDWTAVEPGGVSHLLFVCGPAAGELVEELFDRFRRARTVAVGVSVVDGTRTVHPDVTIERDSDRAQTPDLSLGAPGGRVPVVAVVLSHAQPEYGDRQRHHATHRLIATALRDQPVARVVVDTRLDPRDPLWCATPAQLESVMARVDAVVTTRLHGLVLALRNGVPAVAVDPIDGGGKVIRQARALGWPAAAERADLDVGRFRELLAWCLTPEAATRAAECAARGVRGLDGLRDRLLDELGHPVPPA